MFKSYYLFKFLYVAVILFCVNAYCVDIEVKGERGKVKAESGKVKGERGEVKAESRKVKAASRKVKGESGKVKAKREILRKIYTAEVGVRERSGRNDGPEVEKYLSYVGLNRGQPWCAAFVCWALAEAGVKNPRSGWSPDLLPASNVIWQRTRAFQSPNTPVPCEGDVFGIWYSDKGRIAHVGFVDKWDGKWMISVEGNTNEAGSAEGDGVYRKRRLTAAVYQVADFIKDKRI